MSAGVGQFASGLFGFSGVVSGANASMVTPTNAVTLVTALASGARIDAIGALPRGTITATRVDLFDFDGGSTYNYKANGVVPTQSLSVSGVVSGTAFYKNDNSGPIGFNNPMYLTSGHSLVAAAASGAASGISVAGEAVQFSG